MCKERLKALSLLKRELTPPWGFYSMISSKPNQLQIPLHQGLGIQHRNFQGHKYSAHDNKQVREGRWSETGQCGGWTSFEDSFFPVVSAPFTCSLVYNIFLRQLMHQRKKKSENMLHHLGRRTCLWPSVRLSIKRLKGAELWVRPRWEGGVWGEDGRGDQHGVADNGPGTYFPNFLQQRWSVCTFYQHFGLKTCIFLFPEMFEILRASSKQISMAGGIVNM